MACFGSRIVILNVCMRLNVVACIYEHILKYNFGKTCKNLFGNFENMMFVIFVQIKGCYGPKMDPSLS